MFNAFLIALREVAELLVIAEALRAYLRHKHLQHRLPQLRLGLLGGVLIGLVGAVLWVDSAMDATARAVGTILVGVMGMVLATGMLSSVRALQSRVQASIEVWAARLTLPVAIAGVAAFAAAREVVEMVLFLRVDWVGAGASATLAGAVIGIAAAVCLALLFRSITRRVNLPLMFQLSTLVLALLSIQLLMGGLGELLRAAAPASARGALLDVATPFLPGGHRYLALCAVLMAFPVIALARSWWLGSETHAD